MKDFRLNTSTLRSIQASTGLDATVIATSDISAIDKRIQAHTGTVARPSIDVGGIQPRGSVYLMFKRLFTAQEIDKKLAEIKS